MLNYQMVVHTDCNIVELGIALNKNMQTSQPNIQTVWTSSLIPIAIAERPKSGDLKKKIRIIKKNNKYQIIIGFLCVDTWVFLCSKTPMGFSDGQNPIIFFSDPIRSMAMQQDPIDWRYRFHI